MYDIVHMCISVAMCTSMNMFECIYLCAHVYVHELYMKVHLECYKASNVWKGGRPLRCDEVMGDWVRFWSDCNYFKSYHIYIFKLIYAIYYNLN